MGVDDSRWPNELLTGPGDRAGGRACRAEDALRRVVVTLPVLWALQPLAGARRVVSDQVWLDVLVAGEELVHVDDEVLNHLEADQRLKGDLSTQLPHQNLASKAITTIDAHRVRTADAMGARPAVGQRAVLVPLYLIERIQYPVGWLDVNRILLKMRLDVVIRVVPLDPKGDLHRKLLDEPVPLRSGPQAR